MADWGNLFGTAPASSDGSDGTDLGPLSSGNPQLDQIIIRRSREAGVDPRLTAAVMHQESRFHPGAVSPKGATGLMQLMPATAARFGVRNAKNPDENIRGGTQYLGFLQKRFDRNKNSQLDPNEVPLVLAGYNAGEGAVDRFHGVPPFKETQNYVRTIGQRLGAVSGGFRPQGKRDPWQGLFGAPKAATPPQPQGGPTEEEPLRPYEPDLSTPPPAPPPPAGGGRRALTPRFGSSWQKPPDVIGDLIDKGFNIAMPWLAAAGDAVRGEAAKREAQALRMRTQRQPSISPARQMFGDEAIAEMAPSVRTAAEQRAAEISAANQAASDQINEGLDVPRGRITPRAARALREDNLPGIINEAWGHPYEKAAAIGQRVSGVLDNPTVQKVAFPVQSAVMPLLSKAREEANRFAAEHGARTEDVIAGAAQAFGVNPNVAIGAVNAPEAFVSGTTLRHMRPSGQYQPVTNAPGQGATTAIPQIAESAGITPYFFMPGLGPAALPAVEAASGRPLEQAEPETPEQYGGRVGSAAVLQAALGPTGAVLGKLGLERAAGAIDERLARTVPALEGLGQRGKVAADLVAAGYPAAAVQGHPFPTWEQNVQNALFGLAMPTGAERAPRAGEGRPNTPSERPPLVPRFDEPGPGATTAPEPVAPAPAPAGPRVEPQEPSPAHPEGPVGSRFLSLESDTRDGRLKQGYTRVEELIRQGVAPDKAVAQEVAETRASGQAVLDALPEGGILFDGDSRYYIRHKDALHFYDADTGKMSDNIVGMIRQPGKVTIKDGVRHQGEPRGPEDDVLMTAGATRIVTGKQAEATQEAPISSTPPTPPEAAPREKTLAEVARIVNSYLDRGAKLTKGPNGEDRLQLANGHYVTERDIGKIGFEYARAKPTVQTPQGIPADQIGNMFGAIGKGISEGLTNSYVEAFKRGEIEPGGVKPTVAGQVAKRAWDAGVTDPAKIGEILRVGQRYANKEIDIATLNSEVNRIAGGDVPSGYTGEEHRAVGRPTAAEWSLMSPEAQQAHMERVHGELEATRARAEQEAQAARTDTKTGAGNDLSYQEAYDRIKTKMGREPIVSIIDANGLTALNDQLAGHAGGDELLKAIVGSLKDQGLVVHRIGGDEFAVVGMHEGMQRESVERALEALRQKEIVGTTKDGQEVVVSNLSFAHGTGEGKETADARLYEHKAAQIGTDRPAQKGAVPPNLNVRIGGVNQEGRGGPTVGEGEGQGEVVPAVKPWEMTADEIDGAYERAKETDKGLLTRLFGEEGAKRYNRLQGTANSQTVSFEASQKAYAEVQKMEAGLTEAEQNELFGIGTPDEPSVEDWKDYRQAKENFDIESPEGLGRSLANKLITLGEARDPATMTHRERLAYISLKHGMEFAQEKGWDLREIEKAMFAEAAGKFPDFEDALFMLRRFIKPAAGDSETSAPETPPEGATGPGTREPVVPPVPTGQPGGAPAPSEASARIDNIQKLIDAKESELRAAGEDVDAMLAGNAPMDPELNDLYDQKEKINAEAIRSNEGQADTAGSAGGQGPVPVGGEVQPGPSEAPDVVSPPGGSTPEEPAANRAAPPQEKVVTPRRRSPKAQSQFEAKAEHISRASTLEALERTLEKYRGEGNAEKVELTERAIAIKKEREGVPAAPAPTPTTRDAQSTERAATIDRILEAARKPMDKIVEKFELKGTDGKWRSPMTVFPEGVRPTGERRSAGFVFENPTGGTYAPKHFATEAEARKFFEDRQASTEADFRENLEKATDAELTEKAAYWLNKGPKAPEVVKAENTENEKAEKIVWLEGHLKDAKKDLAKRRRGSKPWREAQEKINRLEAQIYKLNTERREAENIRLRAELDQKIPLAVGDYERFKLMAKHPDESVKDEGIRGLTEIARAEAERQGVAAEDIDEVVKEALRNLDGPHVGEGMEKAVKFADDGRVKARREAAEAAQKKANQEKAAEEYRLRREAEMEAEKKIFRFNGEEIPVPEGFYDRLGPGGMPSALDEVRKARVAALAKSVKGKPATIEIKINGEEGEAPKTRPVKAVVEGELAQHGNTVTHIASGKIVAVFDNQAEARAGLKLLADRTDIPWDRAENLTDAEKETAGKAVEEVKAQIQDNTRADVDTVLGAQQTTTEPQPKPEFRAADTAKEKVDPRTGLTNKQEEFVTDTLEWIVKADAKNTVIDVPGDGTFKIPDAKAANAFNTKITGKPIPGMPKVEVGRGVPASTTPAQKYAKPTALSSADAAAKFREAGKTYGYEAADKELQAKIDEADAANAAEFERLAKEEAAGTKETPKSKSKSTKSKNMGDPLGPPPVAPDPIAHPAESLADYEMAALGNERMPMSQEPVEGAEKGKVSSTHVIRSYEAILHAAGKNVPIRIGRFRERARGIFKPHEEVIRTAAANNIPTAAHETGHAIQKAVWGTAKSKAFKGLLPPGAKGELVKLGRKLYGDRKPTAGYTSEGYAEFMRHYLTRDDAAQVAPIFHKFFTENVLPANAELAKAIGAARETTDTYRNQGAANRAEANLAKAPTVRERIAKIIDATKSTATNFVDEFTPLLHLSRQYTRVTGGKVLKPSQDPFIVSSALRGTAGAKVEYMLFDGMIDSAANEVGPALADATAMVKGRKEDFTHYLWARRALELHSFGMEPGMTKEDAQYIVDKLGTPEFQMAADRVYEWNDGILDYVGQMVPELLPAIEKMREKYKNYVPLNRAFDEPSSDLMGRLSRQAGGNPFKRIRGSGRRVNDIFPQMIANAEKMVGMAHKRKVLSLITRLADVEGMGHIIEEVPKDLVPHSIGLEQISRQLEAAGVDLTEADMDQLITFFTPAESPKGKDPIVPIMKGNEVRWYHVNPRLYDTLAGQDLYRLPKVLDLFLGAPARASRLGTTGLRPAFSLFTNPARDIRTFLMQTRSHKNPAALMADYVRGMTEAMDPRRIAGRRDPMLDTFMRLGAQLGQPLGADIAQTSKPAARLFQGPKERIVRSPINALRELLSLPEAGPRIAELHALADEVGWDKHSPLTFDQAIQLGLAAKQVTVDFSAMGRIGKVINQMSPFFNVGIQGPRQAARVVRTNPKRALAWALSSITMPALALWWKNKDEAWYRDLPDAEKFAYYHFPVGDQRLKIPRAFEWDNVFSVMPEAIADSWYRQDPEGLKGAMGFVFDSTMPNIEPVPLKIAKEQWQNRIEFFNRPIVPRGELDLRPGEQRGPYTSGMARWLGDTFPEQISPRRVDALIQELGGGAASDVASLSNFGMGQKRDYEPSDIPVVGKMFAMGGKEGLNSKSVEKLYAEMNRASAIAASRTLVETKQQKARRAKLQDAIDALKLLRKAALDAKSQESRQQIQIQMRRVAENALAGAPAP